MSADNTSLPRSAVGAFTEQFMRAYPPAVPPADVAALWIPFVGDDPLLRRAADGALRLIDAADRPTEFFDATAPLFLGTLGGRPCLAARMAEASDDDGLPSFPVDWERVSLRALYGRIDDASYGLLGYAAQILRFERQSRYCPVDGTPTEPVAGAWARRCPQCGHTYYPPVSPAVLILVHDGGDRILLARKPGWGRRFSILAGFVEPGETLEECCWREALEEAGIRTGDFTYAGSQPWPYPHQLMVGFFCRYESGEIRPDESELEQVDWFHVDNLPELPPPLSLSRQLIDRWAATRRAGR